MSGSDQGRGRVAVARQTQGQRRGWAARQGWQGLALLPIDLTLQELVENPTNPDNAHQHDVSTLPQPRRNPDATLTTESNEKQQQAYMRKLIRLGLVEGCACGCRGDYEINADGMAWLYALSGHPC